MEVSCTSCPARFAVPDDKVRGRKVRIKCKRCSSPIVIDGTAMGPSSTAAPSAPKPAQVAKPIAQAPKPATAVPVAAKKAEPAAKPAPAPAAAARPVEAKTREERPSPVAARSSPLAAASPRAAASAPRSSQAAPRPQPAEAKPASSRWREPAAADPPPFARPAVAVPRPAGPAPAPAQAPRPASNKRTMLGGLEAPPPPAPAAQQTSLKRTMLGIPMPAAPAPEPAALPQTAEPEPEPEAFGEFEPEWTVALTDDQHEEMRTTEVIELFTHGTIDHETFIWADGMEDWKRPWEIPLISAALSARGLRPPTSEEAAKSSPLHSREPEAEDQTIVASVRFGPGSSRSSTPSGVWHEPGREDDDEEERGVGFDDVTVSLDTREAQQLMRAAAGQSMDDDAEDATDSVEYDDSSQDDLPTAVHDFENIGEGVDGLLSGMDDPARRSFQAESRPLSDWPTMNAPLPNYDDEDQTTIHEQSLGHPAQMSPLVANEQQLHRIDALIDSAARMAPPTTATAPLTGPYPQMPMSFPSSVPARKKSGSLWWLWLLILLMLIAGAGGASFYLKQPPNLYGPDGMPKIPLRL